MPAQPGVVPLFGEVASASLLLCQVCEDRILVIGLSNGVGPLVPVNLCLDLLLLDLVPVVSLLHQLWLSEYRLLLHPSSAQLSVIQAGAPSLFWAI